MLLYLLMGFAIVAGGIILAVTALVAIAGAWNSLPIHKIDLGEEYPETALFDWKTEGF